MPSKYTITDMQEAASDQGGKCLSQVYVNAHTKLRWRCCNGHEWEAKWNKIQQGRWCPFCSGNVKGTLIDLQKLAKSKGGECLSPSYLGSGKPHEWKCAEGHRWFAAPSNIKKRHWCPSCYGNTPKTTEEMQQLAKSRGGRFLSKSYVNSTSHYLWRCAAGHEWKAKYGNTQQGNWCPQCQDHSSERICRANFESIFKAPFPSRKPKWLMNSRGNRMELDGYNESLSLAFEYQGAQHYRQHDHWHRSTDDVTRRQKDDQRKAILCRQKGVTLIAVPYTVPLPELQSFIVKECRKAGATVSKDSEETDICLTTAYSARWMDELRQIAHERGGECLSDNYINAHTRMNWRCAAGHRWEATASTVKHSGNWCPFCAGKAARTIDEMREHAKQNGGRCLSDQMADTRSHLEWECAKGHRWSATPHNIIHRRSWCPACAGRPHLSIEDMRNLAKERGGKCLSDHYTNRGSVMLWECFAGHRWESRAANVRAGSWCPKCEMKTRGERVKLGLQKRQQLK